LSFEPDAQSEGRRNPRWRVLKLRVFRLTVDFSGGYAALRYSSGIAARSCFFNFFRPLRVAV
jgi:hypothetical protein